MPTPMSLTPPPEDDPLVRALTGALARRAEAVSPSPDGLQRIRARIEAGTPVQRQGRGRLGWVAAAAAGLLVVGGVELAGQQGHRPGPVPGAPAASTTQPGRVPTSGPTRSTAPTGPTGPTGSAAPTGSPATPTGAAARPAALPVYYAGRSAGGWQLFREFHPAPSGVPGTVAGRVRAAVNQALSQPPDDPDYRSLWVPSAAATTTVTADLITIVLNEAAAGGTALAGSAADAAAVQQLIWTATAAAAANGSPAPGLVQIRALGPTPDRIGTIDLTRPFRRGDQPGGTDPRAPVWIDSLGEGDRVPAGPLNVQGEATGSAGRLTWTLTRGGVTVATGTVRPVTPSGGTPSGTARGAWTVQLDPPDAGPYTITVSGGTGSDSKDFVVRG